VYCAYLSVSKEELVLSLTSLSSSSDGLWRLYVYYAYLSVSKEELVLSLMSLSSSSDGLFMPYVYCTYSYLSVSRGASPFPEDYVLIL
jgi:hypothetical protein